VDRLVLHLLALIVLLCLSAFFSGSEAALFSLTRSQVRSLANTSPAGREIKRLLEHPRKLLVSILLGNLVVNIFATSAATAIFISSFGDRGAGYAFLLMSGLIILFGEIFPKAVALHGSQRIAAAVIFPLRAFHAAVLPVRVPLSMFSDSVIAFLGRRIGQSKRSFTWEELITALRIAESEGEVGRYEYEVLSNVLEFREKIVKEIMTPSIHVVSASVRSHRSDLMRLFAESRYSRVPIHDRSPDDIVGVLHIKDLVDPAAAVSERDLRGRMRHPFFVQETTPIAQLYSEMQLRQEHAAIVLDEFGSFAGIVTTEDILEELVGEIRDARDPRTAHYMRLDDNRIVVLGSMEIDDFNRVFGAGIEDDEVETVAGYVMGRTGRVPREGETIELGSLRFHVISAQPNRIRKMRVERMVG
jgi:putative hemolysin